MFKKLLAAVGVGGVEVETELHTPGVQPGGTVHGVIRLRGGGVAQDIDRIALELVTRVEFEHGDGESEGYRGFHLIDVHGPFTLTANASDEFPFALSVPFETPITFYNGRHLPGTEILVRTVVEISGAVDAGDRDPLGIGALPAQHVILAALEQLGFPLHRADVEWGRLRGVQQQLPFYQEIEFGRSHRYPRLRQLEVTFVARPEGMDVVLEGDKKSGWISESRDVFDVLRVDYQSLDRADWAALLHQRLERMSSGH
ncbi:sporulation protein [Nocardia uniformis]|uniref:Sporulation protein n=1 Tax=Nocardia uniformis TaxID=53432 RepID=A0A849C2E5_9NOCA|nr:sporulation protein [Nocardia uniformis]NNH72913.1 sporulation protein [Nocardia uniformis]